jgi:hypothetical protein
MSFSSSLYTLLISLQSASLDSVSQFCSSELFLNTFTIVGLHNTSLVRHPEIQYKVWPISEAVMTRNVRLRVQIEGHGAAVKK